MSLVSSTSSIVRNFPKEYIYPDWFTEKKYKFYERMLERLEKLSHVHTQAAEYNSKMSLKIFAPSITITALSSIASFLSTADFIDTGMKNGFAVTVGVFASISTMMQSLASALKFSAKVESHRQAAEEYNKLIIRVKFEMEMPNEENFTDELEQSIIDVQNKCNYFPPQFIINNYDKMILDRKLTKLEHVRVDNMIDNARNSNEESTDSDGEVNGQSNDQSNDQSNESAA